MKTDMLFELFILAVMDPAEADSMIYSISADDINGNPKSLEEYRGKTILIVNVASKCGFTYQYESLEALYRNRGRYRRRLVPGWGLA